MDTVNYKALMAILSSNFSRDLNVTLQEQPTKTHFPSLDTELIHDGCYQRWSKHFKQRTSSRTRWVPTEELIPQGHIFNSNSDFNRFDTVRQWSCHNCFLHVQTNPKERHELVHTQLSCKWHDGGVYHGTHLAGWWNHNLDVPTRNRYTNIRVGLDNDRHRLCHCIHLQLDVHFHWSLLCNKTPTEASHQDDHRNMQVGDSCYLDSCRRNVVPLPDSPGLEVLSDLLIWLRSSTSDNIILLRRNPICGGYKISLCKPPWQTPF